MAASRIVEALDERERRMARLDLCLELAAIEKLAFEGGEEALAHGIVVCVADRTHRGAYAGVTAAVTELDRSVLAGLKWSSQHFKGGVAMTRRSGMPSDPLAAQSRQSLRSTRHCEPMWRNDWQGSLSLRVGLLFLAPLCAGTAAGMGRGSIGGGQTPGARSRLLAACRSTSRTMRPCASAMKPSIKRCSFKVVARCAQS